MDLCMFFSKQNSTQGDTNRHLMEKQNICPYVYFSDDKLTETNTLQLCVDLGYQIVQAGFVLPQYILTNKISFALFYCIKFVRSTC